jgi:hypothetical protein
MYLDFCMQQWFDAKKFGFSIMHTNIFSIEIRLEGFDISILELWGGQVIHFR